MHHDLEPERALGRALRELPDAAARPYDFREFERRAQARARQTARGVQALAAAVALIVVASAALYMRVTGPRNEGVAQLADSTPAVAAVEATAAARADAMENWLAALPSDPALVRVGTRAAVTGLEDRIAQVDDLLSAARAEQTQPARLSDLQQERLRLVGALVQVRYAETLADATR
jgi:hypothetical protein